MTQVRVVLQKEISCHFFFFSFLESVLCFVWQRGQSHLLNNYLPPKQSHEIQIVERDFLQVQLPERHETAFKTWCSSEVTCSWGSIKWLLNCDSLGIVIMNHFCFWRFFIMKWYILMPDVHHLLWFPVWLRTKTAPRRSQVKSIILWLNLSCSSGSHSHRLKDKIWC